MFVSSGDRYSFLVLDLPLLVLREVMVAGEFIFIFYSKEYGVWESKSKYNIPILSLR